MDANFVCPVHVRDVVQYLVHACRDSDLQPGAYDIGGPDVVTYRQMLAATGEKLGKKRVLIPFPYVPRPLSALWVRLVRGRHVSWLILWCRVSPATWSQALMTWHGGTELFRRPWHSHLPMPWRMSAQRGSAPPLRNVRDRLFDSTHRHGGMQPRRHGGRGCQHGGSLTWHGGTDKPPIYHGVLLFLAARVDRRHYSYRHRARRPNRSTEVSHLPSRRQQRGGF